MSTVAGESPPEAHTPRHSTELTVGGMSCASCAARTEKKLNKLDLAGAGHPGCDMQVIEQLPGTHRYRLTPTAAIAVLFTKTYGRVLIPGLAY